MLFPVVELTSRKYQLLCVGLWLNNSQCLILQRNFMLISGKVLSCEIKQEKKKHFKRLKIRHNYWVLRMQWSYVGVFQLVINSLSSVFLCVVYVVFRAKDGRGQIVIVELKLKRDRHIINNVCCWSSQKACEFEILLSLIRSCYH